MAATRPHRLSGLTAAAPWFCRPAARECPPPWSCRPSGAAGRAPPATSPACCPTTPAWTRAASRPLPSTASRRRSWRRGASLLRGQALEVNWNDQVGLTGFDLPAQGGHRRPWPASRSTGRCCRRRTRPTARRRSSPLHLLDERGELWTQENYQAFYPVPVDSRRSGRQLVRPGHPGGRAAGPLPRHRRTDRCSGESCRCAAPAGLEPGRVTWARSRWCAGRSPADAVDLHIRFPRRYDFGAIRLLGANALETAAPGQPWLAEPVLAGGRPAPSGDTTIVVRIYGNNDELVYEWRSVLLEGVYPTSRWQPGEYVRTNPVRADPGRPALQQGTRARESLRRRRPSPWRTEPGISVIGLAIGSPAK